jgi:predicted transcriptional regulator
MFITGLEFYSFMGQQDVYDYLKAHPNKWFSSKEISQGMNQSIGSVTVCLKKLRIKNEINYKPTGLRKGKRVQYLYKYKD